MKCVKVTNGVGTYTVALVPWVTRQVLQGVL